VQGGNVAKVARLDFEAKTGKKVVTAKWALEPVALDEPDKKIEKNRE